MKKLFIMLLILTLSLINAQELKYITHNEKGDYLLITNSVKQSTYGENYAEGWIKIVKFTTIKGKKTYTETMDKFVVDCSSIRFKPLSRVIYNAKGQILKSIDYKDNETDFIDAIPESTGYAIVNAICSAPK